MIFKGRSLEIYYAELSGREFSKFFWPAKKTTPEGGLNTAVSKSNRYETDKTLEVGVDTNTERVFAGRHIRAQGCVIGR